MIRDLSATLDALLTQPGIPPELGAAQIIFDRPTEPFTPPQTTVDLFLYDIRENVELRSNEPLYRRPLNQQFLEVEPPPMRVACWRRRPCAARTSSAESGVAAVVAFPDHPGAIPGGKLGWAGAASTHDD